MQQLCPTGILRNTKTDRYHPVPFRRAPMPGNADATMQAQRYRSIGHHTEGFDTLDDARAYIAANNNENCRLIDAGVVWEWDGEGVLAMTEFFSLKELETVAASQSDETAPAP